MTEKQISILIVDDNEIFLNALENTLESIGWKIVVSPDAKSALHVLGIDAPDCILSDVRMPGMSGIEFLQEVRKTSQIPFILMTGFSELEDTQEAYKAGASGFLAKPFKKDELVALVQSLIAKKPAEEEKEKEKNQTLDENFCKIPIEEFITGSTIKFDIFLRLTKDRYVKIAHSGEDLATDRVNPLHQKGVHFLYLQRQDFSAYVGFTVRLSKTIAQSKTIDKKKKLGMMKIASDMVMGHMMRIGLSDDLLQASSDVMQSTMDLMTDDQMMLDMLQKMSEHTDHLFNHSMAVSVVSVMIAKKVGWKSPATVYKLSMGALMHDIGKREIDRKILDKSRLELEHDEIKILETHALKGAEILANNPSISSEIIQIVVQHHENCVGTGYPRHLTKNNILPLARIVAVADEFCKLTVKNPNSTGMPGREALARLRTTKATELDPQFLNALEAMLDPSKK